MTRWICGFALALLVRAPDPAMAREPRRFEPVPDREMAVVAEQTLVVGFEIDRDDARLLHYTRKARPFVRPLSLPEPRAYSDEGAVQLEVRLLGSAGAGATERVDLGPLCLLHGADEEPHVAGDTIVVHRDSFLIELPDIEGFEQIEIAYYEQGPSGTERRVLAVETLDPARLVSVPATGSAARREVSAEAAGPSAPSAAASSVLWPEDFSDPDLYRVYGSEADAAERINIVIVPDGYTYAEKSTMEANADAMVAHFRSKTPYGQHDPFMNYVLVYAYSPQSGTDQCDCDIVVETAMGTRFLEDTEQCGHVDNRCLYYGNACDASGNSNIVAAELRAPVHDETIVMVNTPRYGGCGGSRAVYSAGNTEATEIAVHEMGHTLAGLADEYAGYPACGSGAGEINTSTNPVFGAWSEWTGDLGSPSEGAQYYNSCVFRPSANCEMRSLNQPFCPVCNQRWSLVTFAHPRVDPTAPVRSITPGTSTTAYVGVPASFGVETRLSAGTVDLFEWTISGPGFAEGTPVSTDPTAYTHTFDAAGAYTLVYRVTADSNFVKPGKNGRNHQRVTWNVQVVALAPPLEVSAPGAAEPLRFTAQETLVWEDAGALGAWTYDLYRGEVSALASGTHGSCLVPDLPLSSTTDASVPPLGTAWFYLVGGVNPAGRGPLGQTSSGAPRVPLVACDAL